MGKLHFSSKELSYNRNIGRVSPENLRSLLSLSAFPLASNETSGGIVVCYNVKRYRTVICGHPEILSCYYQDQSSSRAEPSWFQRPEQRGRFWRNQSDPLRVIVTRKEGPSIDWIL